MHEPENVTALVEEYRAILDGADLSASDSVEDLLVHEAEWTAEAAAALLELAKAYGSFMLRNALAISLVLEIEDGDLEF
ncbi:MAG: hypothetical protein RBS72_21245 [Sedimentisphaerales bacterium]|nr:hypothetical protein [Sedimentisphaerales bacterium]HOC65155.1 hypothetical protein [Sedimentisphaerales bacterium]HOH66157.1 hypothetical protein [Sedimentisphaerales bacterium]HQA89420.1 hypothetical protein [Sedimentisphaerales bacterium]HQN35681.1 hypothetical protein [Sedimentisphaerales bacterium]